MSLFGSNLPSDVGLRLLLSPLGSNIVVRTACCSVGVVLPVYSTFKAIESKDQDDQHKWLVYWAAYGSFTIAEVFTDKLLHWCPIYYHLKFAFLVWLQLPSFEGASVLYMNHLRPFLRKHQSRLDHIVNFFYGEMSKFASNHETEIQVVRTILTKILLSANQMAREIMHPTQRQIGGPTPGQDVARSDSDSDSSDD